jgi:superfamily I DNA and/or RNA helicase
LAVISPFKRVTRRLTPLIYEQVRSLMPENQRSDDDLKRAMGSAKAGTVHTFQGREHDTVILVLGGGTSGARQWAASTPNLLNVAITRARDRLYVVGDRAAWETVGMAQYLAVLPAFDLEPDDLLPRFQQRATT